MSSFNDCIKFSLNIKYKNIIFLDFFINGKPHITYLAELIKPGCHLSSTQSKTLSSTVLLIFIIYSSYQPHVHTLLAT